MPRPREDEPPSRRATILRGLAFGISVVLGAVAVWLIVTGTTQKRIEIGVLAGLWGLLLAAYSVFGTRHPHRPSVAVAMVGSELDVRAVGAVETREAAAERRAYEYRLEEMLRRQIQAAMAAEVASLRAEVAALRNDFVEKVGGQLRLERIETTRLIGSNLEALQHEVRQVASARPSVDVESFPVTTTSTSFTRAAAEAPAPPVVASVPEPRPQPVTTFAEAPTVVAAPPVAAPPVAAPVVAAPPVAAPPVAAPVVAAPPVAAPVVTPPAPVPPVVPAPAPVPAGDGDPFAALPRLTRFTEFDAGPVASPPSANRYAGRPFEASGYEAEQPDSGRHGGADNAVAPPSRSTGGRRRREADDSNDVLARILERERVSGH